MFPCLFPVIFWSEAVRTQNDLTANKLHRTLQTWRISNITSGKLPPCCPTPDRRLVVRLSAVPSVNNFDFFRAIRSLSSKQSKRSNRTHRDVPFSVQRVPLCEPRVKFFLSRRGCDQPASVNRQYFIFILQPRNPFRLYPMGTWVNGAPNNQISFWCFYSTCVGLLKRPLKLRVPLRPLQSLRRPWRYPR
jgi:hypothetical protein